MNLIHMIMYFAASIDFTKVQYNFDNKISRMLMCYPWESDEVVYKWSNTPIPAIDGMYEHR